MAPEYYITLSSAVVTTIVAWIAVQNHYLAREKLKLDLFERRLAVYQATQDLISCVHRDGTLKELNTIFDFRRATQVSAFLFEPEVAQYLKSIEERALSLWSLRKSFEDLPIGEKRTELATKENEILHELLKEQTRMKGTFSRYLSFKAWR